MLDIMEVDKPQSLADKDEGESKMEVVQLPQKKFYRQRAHSNPICDHIFD